MCLIRNFPQNSKRYLIGIIHRHPNETAQWNEKNDTQFDKVLECEKEIYLMGDFNCDLLQVTRQY